LYEFVVGAQKAIRERACFRRPPMYQRHIWLVRA
jgi:hypothetical protein